MKSVISQLLSFLVGILFAVHAFATDWWTLSDQDFATQYGKQAISNAIRDQATVAWMLFARVNQPKPNQGQTFSQWEMWPSNDDTFSPAVHLFKAEAKVRTRPHLEAPKFMKFEDQAKGFNLFSLPPNGEAKKSPVISNPTTTLSNTACKPVRE